MERYVLLEDSLSLISFLLRFDFRLNEVPLKIPARLCKIDKFILKIHMEMLRS